MLGGGGGNRAPRLPLRHRLLPSWIGGGGGGGQTDPNSMPTSHTSKRAASLGRQRSNLGNGNSVVKY